MADSEERCHTINARSVQTIAMVQVVELETTPRSRQLNHFNRAINATAPESH